MRLSDYEQHKMDEAYSAHMDSEEADRRHKAERERLKTAAGAYIDALLAQLPDPARGAAVLVGDNRAFMLSCMAGFACDEVVRALGELGK